VVCGGDCCRRAGAGDLLDVLHKHCSGPSQQRDLRVGASRECIGHCVAAPAMVEDGHIMRRVSRRRLKTELLRLGIA
jgi:NADH:ubiquinone oxidoreductase subunit E